MMRIAASGAVLGLALLALPASAQYYKTEVVPPAILKMGTHTSPVAGTGSVRVQVLIRPDGSHVVTRIISSTNHGDDAAAREIAKTSTYRPATRGGKAVVYYYDPIFHFSGRTVSGFAGPPPSAAVASGGSAAIDAMLRSGRYSEARDAAQSALASHPNDRQLLQQLGVADYFLQDFDDAADAFYRAGSVPRIYQTVAASAFANAAVRLASQPNPSSEDTAHAVAYAQRAMALDRGPNSQFALGVAELANKQYAAALATLQRVHAAVLADPKSDTKTRYGVDQRLLEAYVNTNDFSGASTIAAEMKRLEPGNNYPTQELGAIYVNQGNEAAASQKYDQAIALYEKAAALGDSTVAVIAYDRAANVITSEPNANLPPNAARIKSYADKALALNPNDAAANFFEGLALFYQYGSSHSPQVKQQALTYLNKADGLAKAAGNEGALVQTIEKAIQQINGSGGM
jgi:tetratricopeptide (TPR) repeat protein